MASTNQAIKTALYYFMHALIIATAVAVVAATTFPVECRQSNDRYFIIFTELHAAAVVNKVCVLHRVKFIET